MLQPASSSSVMHSRCASFSDSCRETVNTPITDVIMALLRYWTTRSSRWTKTGLCPPPGRSWHDPSWNRQCVYPGQCPAHLLCPGRWEAQGVTFPLTNRAWGVTIDILAVHNQSSYRSMQGHPLSKGHPMNLTWIWRFMFFPFVDVLNFLQSACVLGHQGAFSI